MGFLFSKPDVVNSDEDDNFISDPNYRAGVSSDYSKRSFNMALDATSEINRQMPLKCEEIEITKSNVSEFRKFLDVEDKISLIYLLYDDAKAELALQYSLLIVKGSQLDILNDWVIYSIGQKVNWQNMLLEALTIIQNYQALKAFGYKKNDMNCRFLPTVKDTSLNIPLIKKKFYRMFDTSSKEKMLKFLNIIQEDFDAKGLEFKKYDYLEMYFIYWTCIKYISSENLENIIRALKKMDLLDEAEEFRTGASAINDDSVSNNMQSVGVPYLQRSASIASTSGSSSIQHDRICENYYDIDQNNPGICLIINQENFYPEFEDEYKHLMPKVNELPRRYGTNVDRDRLAHTFEKFNYKVILKNDLTHIQIQESLESALKLVENHSSFIVCILSHGLKGSIFSVNTIPVQIEEIKDMMCSKNKHNLRGKPKVLILQSCQGNRCQEVDDDDTSYAMDGPPSTADLLVCYATVPGYAAVRHETKGSWFIQSLCDKIEEHSNSAHFDDICTFVQGDVSSKRWKTAMSNRAMVPMKISTLTKKFYLPRIDVSK